MKNTGLPRHVIDAEASWLYPVNGVRIMPAAGSCRTIQLMAEPQKPPPILQPPWLRGVPANAYLYYYRVLAGAADYKVLIWRPPEPDPVVYPRLWPGAPRESIQASGDASLIAAAVASAANVVRLTPPATRD